MSQLYANMVGVSTIDGQSAAAWVPFGMDDDEVEVHTALRADIPDWLETSLWNWIRREFTSTTRHRSGGSSTTFKTEFLRKCERVLRISVSWNGSSGYDIAAPFGALKSAYSGKDDIEVWRLVDFCLAENYNPGKDSLRSILIDAGSAWTVGERFGKLGLVRRMPDGVVDAAHTAFSYGSAGKRLALAWESAFGVNPDPEAAYSRAVKAVEDAAIPVVSPKNSSATLGTVIGDIRNGGGFSLPHLREHKDAKTHEVLLSMLQMLWTGQHDRHGGPSTVAVPNVTQEEAESAVLLAVTLVGWFETGKVQK